VADDRDDSLGSQLEKDLLCSIRDAIGREFDEEKFPAITDCCHVSLIQLAKDLLIEMDISTGKNPNRRRQKAEG
jgi:hypothetical protein